MSDPVFDKMQQLMGKYQGASAQNDPLPGEPPVLTEIVRLGSAVQHAQPASAGLHSHASSMAAQIARDIEPRLQQEFDTLLSAQINQAVQLAVANTLPILHERLTKLIRDSVESALKTR